ncbi:MAG: methylenetetrahydrofolate reductase C-terminal domain-containing protein [Candidatus Thermoplasmatota archaeon]|nr:methylenetetrahydrofolate reductase C-terminal domain-containing protein [Candidatus Thermoplasmatota archaeon]
MIITAQKPLQTIIATVGKGPVFLIGCSECATLCHTGGEEEVQAMKETLKKHHVLVTGCVILDPACHLQNDKRLLRQHADAVKKAQKILVLACGNGTQTVAEIITDADVICGTDTLFLGEIQRANQFEERCQLCGECILDQFAGFCPVARCPKSMLNGPCGGSIDGQCEVHPDLDCVWYLIYKKLKEQGKTAQLRCICQPKDWSKSTEMKRSI